jgi:hypothetical protein
MRTGMAKEVFNVAYVLPLAAQAGLNTSEPRVDDDSVDLMIIGSSFTGRRRETQISLQLKCSSQDLINGEHIKFPLKLKNYNDLRGRNISNPRYLVVTLPLSSVVLSYLVTRRLCVVPRASVARTASGWCSPTMNKVADSCRTSAS